MEGDWFESLKQVGSRMSATTPMNHNEDKSYANIINENDPQD